MSEKAKMCEAEEVLAINDLPWVKNIGTKTVDLVPMSATEAERHMSHKICMDDAIKDNGEGYLVRYKDGYVSWSPKTPADEAYRPVSTRCETKAPKTRSSIPHSKTGVTMMRPYAEGEDLGGITVSEHGSPVKGGMICHAEDNVQDQWYISPKYYSENYVPVGTGVKTLHNSEVSGARKNVKDIRVVGNGDMFQLLCKASSEKEGWMKSTKAMDCGNGQIVIQVTTQQRNIDWTYSIAEALTVIQNSMIVPDENNGRKIVALEPKENN